jgi:RNA polymerase sigma-70 factor (ECF subfamily)
LNAIQQRAVEKLEALYRDSGPHLLSWLERRHQDPELARDLLHEAFAAAAHHPERFLEAASPRAWLFAIARNLSATHFRRNRPAVELTPDIPADGAPADDRLAAMRQAISNLQPEWREVLELRLDQELSYEEIAEVLDIPTGTVRSRLHHAVRQLRQDVLKMEKISTPSNHPLPEGYARP